MRAMRIWSGPGIPGAQGRAAYTFSFFGRPGGVSSPPYESLNLSTGVGDDPGSVADNESLVLMELGADSLTLPEQVHSSIVESLPPSLSPGITRGAPADALVTREPGAAIGVLCADCVPIVIGHPRGEGIAVIHAGWKGLAEGVIPETLKALEKLDIRVRELEAHIGPAIGPCCFHVDDRLARRFSTEVEGGKNAVMGTRNGTVIDLPAIAWTQLLSRGLARENIKLLRRCTACETRVFFSYRKSGGTTGRQLSAVILNMVL